MIYPKDILAQAQKYNVCDIISNPVEYFALNYLINVLCESQYSLNEFQNSFSDSSLRIIAYNWKKYISDQKTAGFIFLN